MWGSVVGAVRALASPDGRILDAIGPAPMGGEYIEITIDETPLRAAMVAYSISILKASLLLSLIVASLAVVAIHMMVLRPVRRLTSNLIGFGADPEDASRIIQPSGKRHEIGRAEEALADMQAALVGELNQKKHLAALGLAVAKINHDLRNMLATAQLLSDRMAQVSDPLARRFAPKLVETLDRAIAFCQSTLAYGRAAERPPKMTRFALRAAVTEAVESVAPAELRQVEIENRVPADLRIVADSEHLFRVLANLCRNAVQALESAGPQPGLPARVTIDARADSRTITIEISDTGPGVPASARERLFQAFQGSTRAGGAGLGLAIAADLIRAHGGEIALLPQAPAGGAAFRVTLPRLTLNGAGARAEKA
jgi:signal transduction histidine kinase